MVVGVLACKLDSDFEAQGEPLANYLEVLQLDDDSEAVFTIEGFR